MTEFAKEWKAAAQDEDSKTPWPEALPPGGCSSLELTTLPIMPRPLLIDNWCREGDLGFLFASRGVGKTWLAMHLAHGVATLKDVGPWKIHNQLKVLYLDGEMPPSDIKARDGMLGVPTENLVYVNHEILFERTGRIMNLADSDFQNACLEHCQKSDFEMLCLDNLSTLASGVDENKTIDWEIIQPWLLRLRRAHITVLFIHHAGRNNQMRGGSKREDPAFWILRLDAPTNAVLDEEHGGGGAHFVSRFTKWRNAVRQPKTYEWKYSPSTNGEVLVEVKDAGALPIFRSWVENGLDTCTMIAAEMGVTPGYVSQLATQAEKEGWLKKENRKYVLTGAEYFV